MITIENLFYRRSLGKHTDGQLVSEKLWKVMLDNFI